MELMSKFWLIAALINIFDSAFRHNGLGRSSESICPD